MSQFINLINQADRLADLFREAWITAIDFEDRLVTLGFYNIEFDPPAAAYCGVRYVLEPNLGRKEI